MDKQNPQHRLNPRAERLVNAYQAWDHIKGADTRAAVATALKYAARYRRMTPQQAYLASDKHHVTSNAIQLLERLVESLQLVILIAKEDPSVLWQLGGLGTSKGG